MSSTIGEGGVTEALGSIPFPIDRLDLMDRLRKIPVQYRSGEMFDLAEDVIANSPIARFRNAQQLMDLCKEVLATTWHTIQVTNNGVVTQVTQYRGRGAKTVARSTVTR